MSNLILSGVWGTVLSVVLAVIILLAMITVHEFGHYLSGRILDFKIDEFSIGFGPALFKRKSKKSGRVFSVRAFPLGGYCAFAGEDGDDKGEEVEGVFNLQSPWKRIIVLVSGALMNYLLALVLIVLSFAIFGMPSYKINSVEASEDFPAEYSLVAGDVIEEADGRGVYLATDLISALNGKEEGEKVALKVLRDGEEREIEIIVRSDCDFSNSSETSKIWRALGVGTYEKDGTKYWDLSSYNRDLSFGQTVGKSFVYSFRLAGSIFKVLGELLTGNLSLTAVGGPVTTIKLTSEIAAQGVESFLQIAAYIGVNLAVFNLLPIPALDGSKVVFCLIEWIFKKPVPRKIEAIIHAVGLILIVAFAVLVDILQFTRC